MLLGAAEPVFLNVDGDQELIPRNEFRSLCIAWRAGTITLFLLVPSPHRLFKNSSSVSRNAPAITTEAKSKDPGWRDKVDSGIGLRLTLA
jgi:hypothetical protein